MGLLAMFKKGYRPLPQSLYQGESLRDRTEETKEEDNHDLLISFKRERDLKRALYSLSFLLIGCFVALTLLSFRIKILATARDNCSKDQLINFRTPLGRDTRYMTRDHSSDFLWDPLLADQLGEFATPGEEFETGEYGM